MHVMQGKLLNFLLCVLSCIVFFKLIGIVINQGHPLVRERRLGHFFLKLLVPVLTIDAASSQLKRAPVREIPWQSAAKFCLAIAVSALIQPLLHAFMVSKVWQPPLFVELLLECATPRQRYFCPVTIDFLFPDISVMSPDCVLFVFYKITFLGYKYHVTSKKILFCFENTFTVVY